MSKLLLLLAAVCSLASAQTAAFPTTVASDSHLKVRTNGVITSLRSGVAIGDNVITVGDCSKVVPNMLLTLSRREVVSVTAVNACNLTVVRGFDGTTAQTHSSGAEVANYPSAWDHNAVAAEVKAIESALGPNLENTGAATAQNPANYQWSRSPGGTLTGGVINAVTLTPCPQGVSGTNANHWVYISAGVGNPEAKPIQGGTCTSGASSGTILFTPSNNHTGSWLIGSATAGAQELMYANTATTLIFPAAVTLHGPIYCPSPSGSYGRRLLGLGRNGTLITVASDFPTSATGVFIAQSKEPGPTYEGFSLIFQQPDSASLAAYTQWPAAFYLQGAARFEIRNVTVMLAWDGVDMRGNAGGAVIEGLWMSAFHKGIQIDGSLDTVRLNGFHYWPFGATTNQTTVFLTNPAVLGLEVGRMDDLKMSRALFMNQKAIRFWAGVDGNGAQAHLDDIAFDTNAQLAVEWGQVSITNSYFNAGSSSTLDQVSVTGGTVLFANDSWFQSSSTARSVYAPLAGAGSTTLQFANCRFIGYYTNSPQPPAQLEFKAAPAGGARSQVMITGSTFYRIGAYTFSNPSIYINNSGSVSALTATISGNATIDQASGSPFITIGADDYHRILGNTFAGAIASYPATKTLGTYQTDTNFDYGSAINTTFTGPTAVSGALTLTGSLALPPKTFATLPAAASSTGQVFYCSTCQASAGACATGGSGAFAFSNGSAWRCVQ